MSNSEFNEILDEGFYEAIGGKNDQTEARQNNLDALRELVGNVYPNKFDRTKITGVEDTISNLLVFEPIAEVVGEIKAHIATLNEGERPNPELKESLNVKLRAFNNVRVSGRLTTTPRTMGKAAFVHLSDGVNRIQIYVRKDDVKGVANDGNNSEVNGWELFKLLDGGDFIGVEGYLFLTNTGELSVHVETLQFLSKSLLPMPDKMHGIADPELRRRYRYADLIASSLQVEHEGLTTREVFERRAKLISGMRRYLDDAGYIEVETPMLTPKATGAAAKPFSTHHNALDIPLYARIAPELYLKRLTVGGFEKVYELNRNFRNEGLSQRHNPEFTMLEFYCAYMDVNGMMDFAEAMIQESVKKATGGSLVVKYDLDLNNRFALQRDLFEIDFSNFKRLKMKEAVLNELSFLEDIIGEKIDELIDKNENSKTIYDFIEWFDDEFFHQTELLDDYQVVVKLNETQKSLVKDKWNEFNNVHSDLQLEPSEIEKNIVRIFEYFVESKLIQPTFIIDYPKSISPLSKASPSNPNIAERFELFINGMECANGFSELNDPREQYERFVDQMSERDKGDDEAMVLDEDYIRALSYGMPPAAGIGIGIDRLVMLLTNKHSIRDVILFPHMRPIVKSETAEEE